MTNVSETKTEQEQLEALKKDMRETLSVALGYENESSIVGALDLMEELLVKTWDTAQYLEAQRHKSHHNPV